jgi:competence protein ComEC
MRLHLLPLLAFAFATGIALSGCWMLPPGPPAMAAMGAVLVVCAALRWAPRLALLALLALGLSGGAFWEALDRALHPNLFQPWIGKRVEVIGQVLDEPVERGFGRVCRVRVVQLRRLETTTRVDARLLLRTSGKVHLAPGHRVCAAGILRPLRSSANFGGFNYARYMAREHVHATLTARDPFVQILDPADPRWDRRLALGLRDRLAAVHLASLPPDEAALMNGIVFGSRATPVPDEIERDFRNAGVVHVLVASGAQIAVLIGIFLQVLGWAAAPRWASLLITLAGAWLYTLMAGGAPAMVRASITAGALAVAQLLGRQNDPLSLLALAALVILGLSPGDLFDLGFQLSFAAVGGMILLGPRLRALLHAKPGWLWGSIGYSLAAQLATMPLIAHAFCQVAPVGVLANLIAIPASGLLLGGGLAVSVVGLLWPGAAFFLDSANLALLWALRQVIHACARVPGGHFWVPPPGAVTVALLYAGLLAIAWLRREHLALLAGSRVARASGLALVALFAGSKLLPSPPLLRVTFLDVGQGDSTLVQTPSGRTLLVDGGGVSGGRFDFGERVLLPALLHRGVRGLDCIVATHPQGDHIGGLAAVCRELPVEMLIEPDVPSENAEMERLLEQVRRRGIRHLRAQAGVSWMLDPRTRVTLLHPPEPRLSGMGDVNDHSVVLRVEYGRTSFLLAADIGREVEAHLVRSGAPLEASVLKVAHHGSRTSSGEAFLDAVRPRVAVVSVGEGNLFGHPATEVIRRLAARAALTCRTDEEGAVEVSTDGEVLNVRLGRHPGASPWRLPAH